MPVSMWTGRKFKLRKQLHSIERIGDKEVQSVIPNGEIVEVIRGPFQEHIRVVEVRWQDRRFVSFAIDLASCGEEIRAVSS